MDGLEREAMDHEFGARYDDIYERFGADLRPCPICGAPTIDPFDHCELPGAGHGSPAAEHRAPTVATAGGPRPGEEVPF